MDSELYGVSSIEFYGALADDILEIFEADFSRIDLEKKDRFRDILHTHLDRVKAKFLPAEHFFNEETEWFNTSSKLSLTTQLRRRILILDFFTACCINCTHILPYLRNVEEEYEFNDEVTIIGVHSPKFPHEKSSDYVKNAIDKNYIHHPVVNDPDMLLWKKFNIFCWPTVVILGPQLDLLFVLVGETQIAKLLFIIENIMDYYEMRTFRLNSKPLPICASKIHDLSTIDLSYPAGVSTHGSHVLVSDTGNNRLILCSTEGVIKEIIGTGIIGCKNGPLNSASFFHPRGTAWHDMIVYVADTGNHSIRKVDLLKKEVTCIFIGEKDSRGRCSDDSQSKTKFRSPWDLCIAPKFGAEDVNELALYVAVAGSHQIWSLDLTYDTRYPECVPFAGNGKEESRNNVYRLRAGFAQPSGIDYLPGLPYLFVADSESSTVRSISLKDGAVKTIVGGGSDPLDLFQFGDVDGIAKQAKLQHPLSLCVTNGDTIHVADTYNNKIKIVNITEKKCSYYDIKGGNFYEPSAICHACDGFYVADTNNHCIKYISQDEAKVFPVTRKEVFCMEIPDLEAADYFTSREKPFVEIKFGGQVNCSFHLNIVDSDCTISKEEPQPFEVSVRGKGSYIMCCFQSRLYGDIQPAMGFKCDNFEFANDSDPVNAEVYVSVKIPICNAKTQTCKIECFTYTFIIESSITGCKSADLKLVSSVN